MLLQLPFEEALSLTRFGEFANKVKPQKNKEDKVMGSKGRKNVKKPKKPKENKK